MAFSTSECAWKHVSIKILGKTIVGIESFEFEKNTETEYLYGAGDEPIDIQDGNKAYPGSLGLLKYEVDQMNDAAFAAGFLDVSEVPHEAVVITTLFKKRLGDPTRTITSTGVKFGDLKIAMSQNAKSTVVPLPFKAMKTVLR
jgi:hypothetical protein